MESPYDFIRPVRDPAKFVGRAQLLREIIVPAESPPLRDIPAPVAVAPGAAPAPQPLPRPEPARPALRAPRSNWVFILVAFAVLASLGLTFVLFFLD